MGPSERFFKEFNRYLDALPQRPKSEADIHAALQEFAARYNMALDTRQLSEETARTADDYMELAQAEKSQRKKLPLLKKALELDERNIDAARMVIELSKQSRRTYRQAIEELFAKAKAWMEEDGFFAKGNIGKFWLILETRPFMRLYGSYMECLMDDGRLRQAERAGLDMLRLCRDDNMGIRYTLMHLYAELEDEKGAAALQKKFKGEESTMFLWPLSLLYYKLGKEEKAKGILQRLMEINADTKEFFSIFGTSRMYPYLSSASSYRADTIEEYMASYQEYRNIYNGCESYFDWAKAVLKGRKKPKK